MDKLIQGLLEKAYNKTPEEISELLYTKSDDSEEEVLREDALDLVLDLDGQRVADLKTNAKPNKDTIKNLRDQMRSEVMTDFEAKVKAEYGIESSKQGLDLVHEVVQQASDCDISDEKIKTHPVFLQMEETKNGEIEALQQEYNDYKLNQDRRTRLDGVKRDVLKIFASLNPIESENTTVANTRREDFLHKFDNYDYEVKDGGGHFVMKDGNRVEDKHGNPIKFEDHVKQIASVHYDFAQSSGSNSGNKDTGDSSSRVDIPKDKAEYLAKMADLMAKNDKEGIVKLNEAWRLSQKS